MLVCKQQYSLHNKWGDTALDWCFARAWSRAQTSLWQLNCQENNKIILFYSVNCIILSLGRRLTGDCDKWRLEVRNLVRWVWTSTGTSRIQCHINVTDTERHGQVITVRASALRLWKELHNTLPLPRPANSAARTLFSHRLLQHVWKTLHLTLSARPKSRNTFSLGISSHALPMHVIQSIGVAEVPNCSTSACIRKVSG